MEIVARGLGLWPDEAIYKPLVPNTVIASMLELATCCELVDWKGVEVRAVASGRSFIRHA